MNPSNQVPDPAILGDGLPDRLGGTRGVSPHWQSEGHHCLGTRDHWGVRGKSVWGLCMIYGVFRRGMKGCELAVFL